MAEVEWITTAPFEGATNVALDGSTIRRVARTRRATVIDCVIPAGAVGRATYNLGVEEIWVITSGFGEFWRRAGDSEEVVTVGPGTAVSIPAEVDFQVRNLSDAPLRFLCTTMPPWPGPDSNQPAASERWPSSGVPERTILKEQRE